MTKLDMVVEVLAESLALGERAKELTADSLLLGGLPELDSQGVLLVVLGLEERFGIEIDGEDLSAEIFETVGTLTGFTEQLLTDER